MAVVKANAYGHGLVTVAKALSDRVVGCPADAFGVARLEEALELRAAGITQSIVLLEGVFDAHQLQLAAEQSLEIVVHDAAQLAWLEEYSGEHRYTVWLKFDTGMNRLGFSPAMAAEVGARLAALRAPLAALRFMTHLARADESDSAMTHEQISRFAAVLAHWPTAELISSIANSAGVFLWPAARTAWVRPGIALYGGSPAPARTAASFGLAPVMTLESQVIALRHVAQGTTVGYGGAWRAARDSRIAIVAGGYGDGVPRHLPTGAPVLIAEQRAPLVGRVSMDMIAVDVTDLRDVGVGTPAVLWGRGLPVDEIAAAAGTISYDVLCGLGRRVPVELR